RLDSSTRRRLLPTVMPKPRSNGSTLNLPYVSVSVPRSLATRFGSSRPRHRIRMFALPRYRETGDRGVGNRESGIGAVFCRLPIPNSRFPPNLLTCTQFNNQLLAQLALLVEARIDVGPAGQTKDATLGRLRTRALQKVRDRQV